MSPLFIVGIFSVSQVISEVERFVTENLEDSSCFLVEVKFNPGNQKLQVFIDGDQGVSIDKCTKLSRKLGDWLDEKNVISTKYTLEVSSAGMENPLKLKRQYTRHVGKKVSVKGIDGAEIVGLLQQVEEEKVTIQPVKNHKKGQKPSKHQPDPIDVKFGDIKETKLIFSI